MNKNTKILSIGSVATAGKDLFFNISKNILSKNGYNAIRFAYADAVKRDLDPFLLEKVGISAFTSTPEEKELIRPFVVCYSTTLMRKINPNVWINNTRKELDRITSDVEKFDINRTVLIGTDTRFSNEVDFIHELGGQVIHLKKYKLEHEYFESGISINKIYTKPVNDEEAINDPLVQQLSDIRLEWKDIGGEYNGLLTNEYLISTVLETLNKTKYFINNRLTL